MHYKRGLSIRVKPLSINSIRLIAKNIRKFFKIKSAYIDIEALMETLIKGGVLIVCERNDLRLKGKYALTYPDKNIILINEDIYDKACDGDGRARFTVAHEIGHLFIHKDQMSFARTTTGDHKPYEDAEWQADTFASHFLIYDPIIPHNCKDKVEFIAQEYGTSYQAAKVYLDKCKK